jgi:hypothetical protein
VKGGIRMTQVEILKLALEGAKVEIASAVKLLDFCVTSSGIEEMKARIKDYDEITELIENEMHSGVATKEEST